MSDQPNWKPLEAVIPIDDCADWMWMGRVTRGHRVIEQYKHRDTRGYLNLDQDGNAWQVRYTADSEVPDIDPMPLTSAIERALS